MYKQRRRFFLTYCAGNPRISGIAVCYGPRAAHKRASRKLWKEVERGEWLKDEVSVEVHLLGMKPYSLIPDAKYKEAT